MTIDERLDRLTERMEKLHERHEALTQSLELMASMQREHEEKADRRWEEIGHRFGETLQFINQLARIAESPEHRIDHLEGQ